MEKNLEQLRKEIWDAKEAYDTFIKNNSQELTEEEIKSIKEPPSFTGGVEVGQAKRLKFELTRENMNEYIELGERVNNTQRAFAKEYVKQFKKEENDK